MRRRPVANAHDHSPQHFLRNHKIYSGQQCAFAGMTTQLFNELLTQNTSERRRARA